ncbi:MAG: radical SAM protein [Firmicutes bacterium]|nr:radical SAM protein [Bacillota bacterium]
MKILSVKPNKQKIMLVDGYLDEPSCLGVPPYISPQIRYAYGALLDLGINPDHITYVTIDDLRIQRQAYLDLAKGADAVVVIAGATVPGRYLGGRPISLREIETLVQDAAPTPLILGGPIVLCQDALPTVDHLCGEIAAVSLQTMLGGRLEPHSGRPEAWVERLAQFAVLGAELTVKHPSFPYVVCELETFRGCPRRQNCTFCSEGLKQVRYQRPVEDIVEEVRVLAGLGNNYFRLGCQTDLFLYGASKRQGQLYPEPPAIKALYQGIRQAAPNLKLLHLDNVNPATIMRDPARAQAIMEIICKYNTAGDVAAFGLESADPSVLKANNVETTPEETLAAVRLMNEVGGQRVDGIPALLPGLNLIHGLAGETAKTTELNLRYLHLLLENDLLVRRINIRQVLTWGGYRAAKISVSRFQKYKDRVNTEINKPMLERVFPTGTILRNVHVEEVRGHVSFGRQLGSYPILVGIPGEEPLGKIVDVVVVDHGYRSITALPVPFRINEASVARLAGIPGIGKRRATDLFLANPIQDIHHLNAVLDGQVDFSTILPFIDFAY